MPKRLTYEFVKEQFEKENYIFLTKEYKNNYQKLDYICSKGHRHSIGWNSWQQGARCPYCVGNGRPTIEFIRTEFEKEGWILGSTEYINSGQKLDCICPSGHRHSITWNKWQQNRRCPHCAGVGKLTIEFIRSEFEKEGYVFLTTKYIGAHQKLFYKCPKGHTHSITWANWSQRQRCPKCSNRISKWEIEVKKFLDNLNISYVSNDRTQLINPNTENSLELDIWMPKLNKAIECNGIYWHTDKKRKQCDSIKQRLCKDKNIDLLVITDIEWENSVRKTKQKIIDFLGGGNEKEAISMSR